MFLFKAFAALGLGLTVLFTSTIEQAFGQCAQESETTTFESKLLVNVYSNLDSLTETDLDNFGDIFQRVFNNLAGTFCKEEAVREIDEISVEIASGPRDPQVENTCGSREYTLSVDSTGECLGCLGLFDAPKRADGNKPTKKPKKMMKSMGGSLSSSSGSQSSGEENEEDHQDRKLRNFFRASESEDEDCLLCPGLTKEVFFEALAQELENENESGSGSTSFCSSGPGTEFQRLEDCDADLDVATFDFFFSLNFEICDNAADNEFSALIADLNVLADEFVVAFNGEHRANPDVCDPEFTELKSLRFFTEDLSIDDIEPSSPEIRNLGAHRRLARLNVGSGGSGTRCGCGLFDDGRRRLSSSRFEVDPIAGDNFPARHSRRLEVEPIAGENYPERCFCEPTAEVRSITANEIRDAFDAKVQELAEDLTCIEGVNEVVVELERPCAAEEVVVDVRVKLGDIPFSWFLFYDSEESSVFTNFDGYGEEDANTRDRRQECVSPCDCFTFDAEDDNFKGAFNGNFSVLLDGKEITRGSHFSESSTTFGFCNFDCATECSDCGNSCSPYCECCVEGPVDCHYCVQEVGCDESGCEVCSGCRA